MLLGDAPLEVDEEHVIAELLAPRARLDLGQVDVLPGARAQAAQQPAGAFGPEPPEDERGLPLGAAHLTCSQRRQRRLLARATREPGKARFVVATILDAFANDRAAVDLRRQRRAQRGYPGALLGEHGAHGLGG